MTAVALSIALASILSSDRTLARSRIHESLVLIALCFLDVVLMNFRLALFHLVVVVFLGCLASVFSLQVLVKKTTFQPTSPSSSRRLVAFSAMHMLATNGGGDACDIACNIFTSSFRHNTLVILGGANSACKSAEKLALHVF